MADGGVLAKLSQEAIGANYLVNCTFKTPWSMGLSAEETALKLESGFSFGCATHHTSFARFQVNKGQNEYPKAIKNDINAVMHS